VRFEYGAYRDIVTGFLNFYGTQTPATQYRGYIFDAQLEATSLTSSDRIWSEADGSNNVGGLGYSSSTQVTQATDRSTAVTINEYSGQIVGRGDSLAAGASEFFTVNNTTVLNGDNVDICVAGQTSVNSKGTGLVDARVVQVYADHFVVRVTNNDISANTNTLYMNFKVIKGILP